MQRGSLARLCCPGQCAGELILNEISGQEDTLETGELACSVCGSRYPIQSGIARMLPRALLRAEDRESVLKRSEMAARDAQVSDYDRMKGLALFGKIEIPVTLMQMNLALSDVLLEAGCGTGRMTPVFAPRCRFVDAVDFSFASLEVCRKKLENAGVQNVSLIQADVGALPFREAAFTKTVTCQVLEHLPTPEARKRMIEEIARVTEVEGRVVLSAYQHSLFTRLFGKKEGEHNGGIYYYRFTRHELVELLSERLSVQGMTGALVYHYLARCKKG